MEFILKKNDFFYELVCYQAQGGYDEDRNHDRDRDYRKESAMRAFSKIKDLSLNNKWTHFLTITLDPKKHDRDTHTWNQFDAIKTKLLNKLRNYKQRIDPNIQYIITSELHQDGAIHFHGLLYLDPVNSAEQLCYNAVETEKSRRKHDNPHIVVNDFVPFCKAFGRSHATNIYNRSEFVAYYMAKYMLKDPQKILTNLYFRSKGLKKSRVVATHSGSIKLPDTYAPAFEGQFTTVYQLSEDQAKEIIEYINRNG